MVRLVVRTRVWLARPYIAVRLRTSSPFILTPPPRTHSPSRFRHYISTVLLPGASVDSANECPDDARWEEEGRWEECVWGGMGGGVRGRVGGVVGQVRGMGGRGSGVPAPSACASQVGVAGSPRSLLRDVGGSSFGAWRCAAVGDRAIAGVAAAVTPGRFSRQCFGNARVGPPELPWGVGGRKCCRNQPLNP